jgi:hypothetical protein
MTEFIQHNIEVVVRIFNHVLYPIMGITFVFGIAARYLIYHTVKREDWFSREFSKRVQRFVESEDSHRSMSFYVTAKRLLERTYYELFEIRGIMKRRKLDYITTPADRLFLIQHGCAWFVRDTLKQIKFMKHEKSEPKFLEVSKAVFEHNPCFNKLFGLIPLNALNDVLNTLPGLFIMAGIFGNFLGIMEALPTLSGMDLSDPEGTKMIMDGFLLKVSFSVGASIVGIAFSIIFQIFNTICSPEKLFFDVVNRFDNTLGNLWNRCDNNTLPQQISEFDEHRDPIEALAELAIEKEIGSRKHEEDEPRDSLKVGSTSKQEVSEPAKKSKAS